MSQRLSLIHISLFNSEESPVRVEHHDLRGKFRDLYNDEMIECDGSVEIPGDSGRVLVAEGCGLTVEEITAQAEEQSVVKLKSQEVKCKQALEIPKGVSMQDTMSEAIKEAEKGIQAGEVPVGAVIVRKGEIIAAAHNQKETLQDPTAHAEILVIREASRKLGRWRLDDCELYVTAEPCPCLLYTSSVNQ